MGRRQWEWRNQFLLKVKSDRLGLWLAGEEGAGSSFLPLELEGPEGWWSQRSSEGRCSASESSGLSQALGRGENVVGRVMIPKDACVLISGICDPVSLCGKGE